MLLAGIAAFAYMGSFSRYWADDYCYSAVIKLNGLFRGVVDWFMTSGNRFSTITMVWLSELFGPRAIAFLPAAVMIAWTAGWIFFLVNLARSQGWNMPRRWLVLIALLQVFFCVLLAPDRLQAVYWRMGTLHYTFPMALMLFILGWMAARWHSGANWGYVLGSLLLAFFAGGFSETFAALQTGVCLVLAAGVALLPQRRRAWGLIAPVLVGSLLAMGLMMLSPSNEWRQAALPPPDNLGQLIGYALRYSLDFVVYSLRGQPLPIAVFAGISALTAFLAAAALPRLPRARVSLAWALVWLLVGFGLIVCCVAPSAYAGLQYPAGRALMPARFAFLASAGGAAICLGLAARAWIGAWRPRLVLVAASLLLLAACLYPVRAVVLLRGEMNLLRDRAARFDERDAQIRADMAAGQTNIITREVEVVHTLADMGPSPDYWINFCARLYYGVESIEARR